MLVSRNAATTRNTSCGSRGRRSATSASTADAEAGHREQPAGEHVQRAVRHRVAALRQHEPDRAEPGRALLGEPVELRPAVEVGHHHRHVHRDPGADRPGQRRPELAHPAGPQAQHEQRPEEEQRVELGRRRQPHQHPGGHRSLPGPGQHAQREQRDGVQVPVDRPGQRQGRRQREHRGVPGTATGQLHRRADRHRRGQREAQRVDVEEAPGSFDRRAVGGHQLCGRPHHRAGEHRVLHLPVAHLPDVRDLAVSEPAPEVERRDVAVAGVAVDAGRHPGVVPAPVLLHQAEAHGEERQCEQHPQRRPPGPAGEGPAAERPAQHLAAEADERILPRGCDDAALHAVSRCRVLAAGSRCRSATAAPAACSAARAVPWSSGSRSAAPSSGSSVGVSVGVSVDFVGLGVKVGLGFDGLADVRRRRERP